jgi:branched-subunit amino acid ABC-type transport system permease component
MAGALMAPLIAVVPTMGIDFIVRPFFIVIIGGLGNIFGVLGGSLIVGGTESLFTASINTTVAQIIVLTAVVLIMLIRPRGLLGGRRPGTFPGRGGGPEAGGGRV